MQKVDIWKKKFLELQKIARHVAKGRENMIEDNQKIKIENWILKDKLKICEDFIKKLPIQINEIEQERKLLHYKKLGSERVRRNAAKYFNMYFVS